jgi:hypothetical protein
MYQMDSFEMWRERSHGLLREAEKDRLARRLRAARPKRASRSTNRGQIAKLRRATALWGRLSVPFFRAQVRR